MNWDPVDQHRARQRAGDRRARLALGRLGRAARDAAMVFPHHRILARTCSQALDRPRSLAREGARHAAQLDRPLGRTALALRARPARPRRAEKTSSRSSPPATTRLFGAKFMALSPDHPLAAAAAAKNPALAEFIARMQAPRHRAAGRSTPPRSRASTPASRRSIPSIPNGSCRSTSPISS